MFLLTDRDLMGQIQAVLTMLDICWLNPYEIINDCEAEYTNRPRI